MTDVELDIVWPLATLFGFAVLIIYSMVVAFLT